MDKQNEKGGTMKRNIFVAFILSFTLFCAINISIAKADDSKEFKAAVDVYTNSWANWDSDKIADIQADAVGLPYSNEHLEKYKMLNNEVWKKRLRGTLSQYEWYEIKIKTLQTDVIGNIGIASGHYKISRKHKEYPGIFAKKRWSSTWQKADGQWELVFYHFEFIDEEY